MEELSGNNSINSHIEPLLTDGRLTALALDERKIVGYLSQVTKNGSWAPIWKYLPEVPSNFLSGGNDTNNGNNNRPPITRTTGALIPTYLFGNVIGPEVVPVTVTFKGTLLTSKGNSGIDHFTVSASRNLDPGIIRQGVAAQIDNLRPGTWTIIAQPSAISGPTQCTYEIGLATYFMTIYPEKPSGFQCQ